MQFSSSFCCLQAQKKHKRQKLCYASVGIDMFQDCAQTEKLSSNATHSECRCTEKGRICRKRNYLRVSVAVSAQRTGHCHPPGDHSSIFAQMCNVVHNIIACSCCIAAAVNNIRLLCRNRVVGVLWGDNCRYSKLSYY